MSSKLLVCIGGAMTLGLGCTLQAGGATIDQIGGAVSSDRDCLANVRRASGGVVPTRELYCSPGVKKTMSLSAPTFLMFNLAAFSKSNNTDKVDYPIDATCLASIEETLAATRRAGGMVGVRFRYDEWGHYSPEPEWENMIGHLKTIRDSGILRRYADVIMWCELGTIGAYGEQHSSRYGDQKYSTELIDIYLQMFPDDVAILLRTSGRIIQWVNDKLGTSFTQHTIADMAEIARRDYADVRNNRSDYFSGDGEDFSTGNPVWKDLARLGMYNDGYMGTLIDYGTFRNRAAETAFLSGQSWVPYGGEYSGDRVYQMVDGDNLNSAWWPENAIPEMFFTHVNYMHASPWKDKAISKTFSTESAALAFQSKVEVVYQHLGRADLYGSATVIANLDADENPTSWTVDFTAVGYDHLQMNAAVSDAVNQKLGTTIDLSDYYEQDLHTFITQHIGYRLVVRECALTMDSARGGAPFSLRIVVENTGFAAPEKPAAFSLILRNGTVRRELPLADMPDIRTWLPGRHTLDISAALPSELGYGEWEILLRVTFANAGIDGAIGAISFANSDIFDEATGANLVARFAADDDASDSKPFVDGRPVGRYDESTVAVSASERIDFLPSSYTFTEAGHYGFTALFRLDGVPENGEIRLSRWDSCFRSGTTDYYSKWQLHSFNYFFRYKENSSDSDYKFGAKLSGGGTYLMYCPFYSISNYQGASNPENGVTRVSHLRCNEATTPREDKDSPSQLNGYDDATIRPLGLIEGAPSGYDVTFHTSDGEQHYTGTYDIKNVNRVVSENVQFVKAKTLLELYAGPEVAPRVENGRRYPFVGWTMKSNSRAHQISAFTVAVGTVDLYPLYSLTPLPEAGDTKPAGDARPAGVFLNDAAAISADERIDFIERPYYFTQEGLYGYTVMFKLDGVPDDESIRLTRWTTTGTSPSGSSLHSFNYFFRYKEDSTDTDYKYGAKLTGSGIYLMYCPFYSVGPYTGASDTSTHVDVFCCNNTSTGREDKNAPSQLGGFPATVKPLGLIEGAPSGYNITFHTPDGELNYSGAYTFANTNSSKSENVQFRKAQSVGEVYDGPAVSDCERDGLVLKFAGWTLKADSAEWRIDPDIPAVGTMELYPFYTLDAAASGIDGRSVRLDANLRDSFGVRFTIDPATRTATVGDDSGWCGNSDLAKVETGFYVVPTYVVANGRRYRVTAVAPNAFARHNRACSLYLPSSVTTFAGSAFSEASDALQVFAPKPELLSGLGVNVVAYTPNKIKSGTLLLLK